MGEVLRHEHGLALVRHIEDWRCEGAPCIVHQDVNPAELFHRLADQGIDGLAVSNVDDAFDAVLDPVISGESRGRHPIAQDQAGPVPGEQAGRRLSDAPGGPGHHGHPLVQPERVITEGHVASLR